MKQDVSSFIKQNPQKTLNISLSRDKNSMIYY